MCFDVPIVLFIDCGGDLTTPTGTIMSPNYPGQYAHSRECIWRITVQPGRRVKLTFNDLALENSSICAWDYIEVSRCLVRGSIGIWDFTEANRFLVQRSICIWDYFEVNRWLGQGYISIWDFIEVRRCLGQGDIYI